MEVTHADRLSALSRREVPPECLTGTKTHWFCGCEKKLIPCGCPDPKAALPCQCEHYRQFGECACTLEFPEECACTPVYEPCRHILSLTFQRPTFAKWLAALQSVHGLDGDDGYGEAPIGPDYTDSQDRFERVCVMATRYNVCLCGECVQYQPGETKRGKRPYPGEWKRRRCTGYALRHPLDLRTDSATRVGILGISAVNGRRMSAGLEGVTTGSPKRPAVLCRMCGTEAKADGLCEECATSWGYVEAV